MTTFILKPPQNRVGTERLFFHVVSWEDGCDLYCNTGWWEVFLWKGGFFHWMARGSTEMDDAGSCLFSFRCPGDAQSRWAKINGWKTVGDVGPQGIGTLQMQGSSRIDCASAECK